MRTTFLHRAFYYLLAFTLAPALMAITRPKCVLGPPAAQSYTWNFPQEASTLLANLRQQAYRVQVEAGQLQQISRDGNLVGWQPAVDTLERIRHHVNAMDGMMCRLRTIQSRDAALAAASH